ncbi:cell division and transport-associated protein TolQ [Panacagrimonas perspica]|uniref:Tol-Pal system protein TolQ n=1 Tax=Panacagrimonas perspica TaxID=381431 RepID=A0A4R7PD29_9GAMM|nr:protein TolQ [Panacagrimonas perspica]TDU31968.1 cell division and transport-associated protein TolQ [Panacagrimonas perspica]THD04493.1 protein TolQ [Panacagrimonas perspica]
MNAELSIAHLIAQASVLVQIIMGVLILASVVSWAVIVSKRQLLSRTRQASEKFEERFWSGGNLADLYESVARNKDEGGLVPIFSAGFEEYKRQQGAGPAVDSDDAIAAVQRQMRVTQVREVEKLEGGLALLATIGSTSPYVGLFGTVWGIMNAFIGIGNMKQASLAVVAPGIAEALIATAMGLFAAIPAVIAFNFFTRSVESLETQYHTFSEEMIGIIERGLRTGKS